MVAVVAPDGRCLFANAVMESVTGVSRRSLQRGNLLDWMADPAPLRETLRRVADGEVSTSRFDGQMRRLPGLGGGLADLPVHVIVGHLEADGRLLGARGVGDGGRRQSPHGLTVRQRSPCTSRTATSTSIST